MDPALQELLLETVDPEEEIDAIIRLRRAGKLPPNIRVISHFGEIITSRVKRKDVQQVYRHPWVISFKAPRMFYSDDYFEQEGIPDEWFFETQPGPSATGKGVVVGIIDWGGDFAHVDFVNTDGTTRFLALWDQSNPQNHLSPQPYGYGKVYYRDRINAALRTVTPYATLGYHPGKTDLNSTGMHGTHVMGIAASNGRSGQRGRAPEADIIFVHLGTGNTDGQFNLGDSVSILEAIDFVKRTAGDRPLVINMSVGKHGGPHDGSTLVELGIDHFLLSHTNTVICQSTGNYFQSRAHCSGMVRPGEIEKITFITAPSKVRENEVEIWYSGKDVFGLTLQKKDKTQRFQCGIESSAVITEKGTVVGRLYHRRQDPNNGRNHINLFLYSGAPTGEWILELEGQQVTDGRFHAWIERADAGQSIFADANIVQTSTTNTICNSANAIVVGAYDGSSTSNAIASFSSSGPTLDGRIRPLFLAPGVQIRSAKSAAHGAVSGGSALMSMSGTSMASPFVTGTVALLLQGIRQRAGIHDVRNMLYKMVRAVPRNTLAEQMRGGYGIIDPSLLDKAIDWFHQLPVPVVSPPPPEWWDEYFHEYGLAETIVEEEALTSC